MEHTFSGRLMQVNDDDRDSDRSRDRRTGATGAGSGPFVCGYDVRVVYTEPEFQRRTPGAPAEYSFTYFGIEARSPEEAIRTAVQDFRETARCSRVSWRRLIERVTVLRRASHRCV